MEGYKFTWHQGNDQLNKKHTPHNRFPLPSVSLSLYQDMERTKSKINIFDTIIDLHMKMFWDQI